ncbi:hypothetical protein VPNG_04858 [Cytospora leucostoma]|uniref:RNA ligase domain-containing protein n=1 Tax=Cytospora leucostoma TaxID=1230097 RepID=A0A423XB51_9PEZI|nr:hypothetical protein VPNG_04858 [Cytospora leucostoma]
MVAHNLPIPGIRNPFDPMKDSTGEAAVQPDEIKSYNGEQTSHATSENGTNVNKLAATAAIPDTRGPFDPMKYSTKGCTSKSNVMKSAQATNDQKVSFDETKNPVIVATIKAETKNKKSNITNQPVTEASVKLDPESHPDETLRLVSLRLVKKILTIRVANRYMSFAEIDGWTCQVPPRAFREGEIVLYFENDSFLPAADNRFASLRPLQTFDGNLGYRVKTRRFGTDEIKIVTQGYLYPVEKFPEIWDEVSIVRQVVAMVPTSLSERTVNLIILAIYRQTNWAESLGIKKWVATQPIQPQSEHSRLGNFPKRIFSGTDITRLQDCPNLFWHAKYQNRTYQESVKMDGASMTVYFVRKNSRYFDELNPLPEKVGPNSVLGNSRFGVCSKNYDLNELKPCNHGYWRTALQYDLPSKLSKLGRNIAISGELCGDGINGNREGIPSGKKEFFVYWIFDIDRQKRLDPREVIVRAEQLGLKHVPVLGYVKIPEIAEGHRDLQKRADEKQGEGLVFKCLEDGRSFKVLSNIYLEKHDV